MKSCLTFVLGMTLVLPLSAFIWNNKPSNPVEGILGENVTLEWNFTLVSANESLDYMFLLRNYRFMIKYSHDGGVVIYKPFKGSVGMGKNGTAAFMLINLKWSDDGTKFCCKVGTKSTQGSDGDIYDDCVALKLLVRPKIVAISRNQTLNESNDVTLSCNATGTPVPNVTWSKSGNENNNFKPGSFLSLRNISREKDGLYWCTAENGADIAIASVRVIVQYSPFIKRWPISQTVNESSVLELFCNATGNPAPNITWSKVADPAVQLSVDTNLKVKNINKTDSGVYQCRASNGIGRDVFASANVTVNFPPSIEYISHDATFNETDDVKLFCNSTGNPRPTIIWTFMNGSVEEKIVGTNETLALYNVKRNQAGIYQCTASNGVMITKPTASVHVTINYKPEIKEGVQTKIKSWINHETELMCEAEGVPVPDITWTRNGIVLSSKTGVRELKFTPEDTNDFGAYVCTATNFLGSTKKSITIEELVAPEAPEILRIDVGFDNMEIHWQASISNRDSPILEYLVKVKERDKSHEWTNCTRIIVQASSSSLSCVMNDLRSGTIYIVQVAALNVVGYSAFTEVEAQTKKPAVMATTEERKQQLLSGATIDGIIAGVICFCSLVVVIVAIVTQRRPCHRDCSKNKSNKRSEECVNEHHNQAFEESPHTDELNEQV